MGCDIHAVIEIKKDNKWHMYQKLDWQNINRNYMLFAKMAGVRNHPSWNIQPISEPKGFPSDMSESTKALVQYWEESYPPHSKSWFNYEEMLQLFDWIIDRHKLEEYDSTLEKMFGFLFGNSINGLKKHREDYPKWLQDVRLIFCFDN